MCDRPLRTATTIGLLIAVAIGSHTKSPTQKSHSVSYHLARLACSRYTHHPHLTTSPSSSSSSSLAQTEPCHLTTKPTPAKRATLLQSISSLMGNCLHSGDGSGYLSGGDDLQRTHVQGRRKAKEEAEATTPSSVLKVKMVLTKAELEWLMSQLKGGDRRLEDVLREMARKRDARGWRPSLESIVECCSDSETAALGFD